MYGFLRAPGLVAASWRKGDRLLNPGRMSQLVRELKNTANQRPSLMLFVGRHGKDRVLQELFPDNNFKEGLLRWRRHLASR